MDQQNLSLHLAIAIKTPEIGKAIAVLDNVHAAMMLLMELPTPALEVLRDEFERMTNDRTGPRGELKRAWWKFTKQVIADGNLRARRGELALYDDLKPGRDYEARCA